MLVNSKSFQSHLKRRLQLIKDVLDSKGSEYSNKDDRMHNFKAAARRLNTSPERALQGMAEKHFVSIQDMINKTEDRYIINKINGFTFSDAYIEEKIGDAINYLILLEAMLKERNTL